MPDWGRDIRERLAGLKVDPTREASVVEEIAQHLDDRFAELTAGGATPEAARQSALDELAGSPALAAALADALPRPAPSRVPPADEGRRRRLAVRPGEGLPLRRAAPAPGAGLLPRRGPLARARHRGQHRDLPAPRRRAPPEPSGRAPAGAPQRAHRAGQGTHGQLLGPLAAADLRALGPHPRRAEGVLEARRLELRPPRPRLRRRDSLRRRPLRQRHVLRHRRRAAATRPRARTRRRHARLPVARRRPLRALLAP